MSIFPRIETREFGLQLVSLATFAARSQIHLLWRAEAQAGLILNKF
jgi:hypothetical protein